MFINIGEKSKEILFVGGRRYPQRSPGTFTTDDKEIQKALEEDKRFNVSYKLMENELPKPPTETERISKLEQENTDLRKENKELQEKLEKLEGKKDEISVPEVMNAQQAREYLVKNFEQDPAKLKNKLAITAAAKKLNVVFPDWV